MGDLVAGVDEAEAADFTELVLQGLDEVEGEFGEAGDRAGEVGEDDQVGAAVFAGAQNRVDGDAAGGHRAAQGAAQIDLAAHGFAAADSEAGGECANQRVGQATHFGEVLFAGAQEIDLVGAGFDAAAGDVFGAAQLRRAQPGFGLDGGAECGEAAVGFDGVDGGVELGGAVHARDDAFDKFFRA